MRKEKWWQQCAYIIFQRWLNQYLQTAAFFFCRLNSKNDVHVLLTLSHWNYLTMKEEKTTCLRICNFSVRIVKKFTMIDQYVDIDFFLSIYFYYQDMYAKEIALFFVLLGEVENENAREERRLHTRIRRDSVKPLLSFSTSIIDFPYFMFFFKWHFNHQKKVISRSTDCLIRSKENFYYHIHVCLCQS